MQTNIYKDHNHGGWVVEFRLVGDRRWHVVGIFGSYAAALVRSL